MKHYSVVIYPNFWQGQNPVKLGELLDFSRIPALLGDNFEAARRSMGPTVSDIYSVIPTLIGDRYEAERRSMGPMAPMDISCLLPAAPFDCSLQGLSILSGLGGDVVKKLLNTIDKNAQIIT